MTYKVGSTEIVSIARVGTFENVYYQNVVSTVESTGFKANGSTWFAANGDVSFSELSANGSYQYTQAMGTIYGYSSGGSSTTSTPAYTPVDTIERFPFAAASTNATDVGNLTLGRFGSAGQSSSTHGYASGGTPLISTASNVIDRFPFASTTTDATDVGDLTVARYWTSAQMSYTHGYSTGGGTTNAPPLASSLSNVIDRFPFADATVNATDVGDLTIATRAGSGISSTENGYMAGGTDPGLGINSIYRFPFASATTGASSIGTISSFRTNNSGMNSTEYGFVSNYSSTTPTASNQDRFPFASSPVSSTSVGTLSVTRTVAQGVSSAEYGYVIGGATIPPATIMTNIIDRFPFATSTANFADVGDLIGNKIHTSTQQH